MIQVTIPPFPIPANDVEAPAKPTPIDQPYPRFLGVTLIEATPNRVRGRLEARNELCRSGQTLHGAAIMALADICASQGAFLNLPEGAATTTIETKTNYISAPKKGEPILAEAIPLHVGRRSSVWQTRVTREDGKLVAMVTQTQMVI
jgi:1,4-dihydroxy-2-naphthoyl-CoA hydrolase